MNCQQFLELRANAIVRNRTWLIPSIMYYYGECKKGRLTAMDIEATVSMIADELFSNDNLITV